MLGLLLLYFIGRSHYRLAAEYGKGEWAFAILGVAVYYAGTFLFGFILGLVMEASNPGSVDDMPNLLLGLIVMPFGLLSTWLLYFLLKRNWEAQRLDAERQIKMNQNGF